MFRPWICALSASFGIAACTLSTTARSQGPADASCPPGYWLMETLCFESATGDVVRAAPAAGTKPPLTAGCAPGYWRLDRLCLDGTTGDVERADETAWPESSEPRN